ncbi:hypothetical protein ACE6H2_026025 [Prunus campanulata]
MVSLFCLLRSGQCPPSWFVFAFLRLLGKRLTVGKVNESALKLELQKKLA